MALASSVPPPKCFMSSISNAVSGALQMLPKGHSDIIADV
jgi:hypothetical protein